MRPGSNHGAKLEPADGQCRIKLFACSAGSSMDLHAPKLTRHRVAADALGSLTMPQGTETEAFVPTVISACGELDADGSDEHPPWEMLSGCIWGCLQS